MTLKKILLLLISVSFNTSHAGEKRGGGSFHEMLIQQGVTPSFINSLPPQIKTEQQYFKEFCEAGAEGLKKLGQLVKFNTQIFSDKLNEVCTQPGKLILRKNLLDENQHILTAVNWPSASMIAINPARWDEIIENHFNSELKSILQQVIAIHEVLSLLGNENSHNYQWSSLILKDSPLFAKVETRNHLEKVISEQALLFEIDASKYYDKVNDPQAGLFAGMIRNHLRHQLISFSPLFDEEIKANVDINYLNDFSTRRSQRGSVYVLGYNPNLIPTILERLEGKFRSLGMRITYQVTNKISWSTVVQLHQLFLAVSEQDSSLRDFVNKAYMDVNGYELLLTENTVLNFSDKLQIDLQKKKMILKVGQKINSIAESLKSYYTFTIKPPYPTYIGQEPQKSINFIQHWTEMHIQPSGEALIMVRNDPFEYFPRNPAYIETFPVSGGGAWWKTKSTGLITASQIRDQIKLARRAQ